MQITIQSNRAFGQFRVLGGDASRTLVGVAFQSLNAPQSKHHPARAVAQIGAQGKLLHEGEARDNLQ